MSCNCCYPEYYTYYDYSYYPEYSEDYINIGKSLKKVGKGIEKVGHTIEKGVKDLVKGINIKEIGEKILGGIEKGIEVVVFGGGNIIEQIKKLVPKNGVLEIPKKLANKLLIMIIEKVMGMVLSPVMAAAAKPVFEKLIWPEVEKPAINLLNKFLPKIKLGGFSLAIETFVYESYNSYGQIEYHTDMYEGYESPFLEYSENYDSENYYYDNYYENNYDNYYENYANSNQVCISQEKFDKMLELALINCK
jgi:hypothetical protein